MFWDDGKKKDEPKHVPMMKRLFNACLLLLGAVIVLWLTLYLLSQFWGWLLLLVAIAALIWGAARFVRWQRDRRW